MASSVLHTEWPVIYIVSSVVRLLSFSTSSFSRNGTGYGKAGHAADERIIRRSVTGRRRPADESRGIASGRLVITG